MKTHNLFRLSAGALLLSTLAACGGGGGEEGPQNSIVKHELTPSTATVSVMAGQTLPLVASVETFGPKITSITWASEAATAATQGSLNIADAQCANAAMSSRSVPGSTGVFVGTAHCETNAIIPPTAKGDFNVSSIVSTDDGSQRVEKFAVTVIPKAVVRDFQLAASALDPVVLTQPIRLRATPALVAQPVSNGYKFEYGWSVLYAPANASTMRPGTSLGTTMETGVLLTTPGKYVFAVTVKFTDGSADSVTKTAYVTLNADDSSVASPMGFTLNAETEQPTVFVGAPAKLTATAAVPSGKIDSIKYEWKQVTGPTATIINPGGSSIFVTAESPGDLLFSVKATMKSGAYTESKTDFIPLRVNPVSTN